MIVAAQAGIMLHPAAELRNAASTTPYLAAGRCGLPRSLASGAALSPSTTWVPPSDRLAFHLDHRHPAGHTLSDSLNYDSAKSGQHQSPTDAQALPGQLLDDIRTLTGNYVHQSEDGDATIRPLFLGLQMLDMDIQEHLHVENHLLFPRASSQGRA
jgi:hypothetical protein